MDVPFLPDLGIDQEAEPESLQNPENEPFRPIQKTQLEEIPVSKEREGPHEQRKAVVLFSQSALPLGWIALGVGHQAAGFVLRIHLGDFAVGPAIMPRRPFRQTHGDIVDHGSSELAGCSWPRPIQYEKVLIVFSVLAASLTGAKEA